MLVLFLKHHTQTIKYTAAASQHTPFSAGTAKCWRLKRQQAHSLQDNLLNIVLRENTTMMPM